jgi:hypothetical protein
MLVAILLGLLLALVAAFLLTLVPYYRFLRSPEKAWRDRVFALRRHARRTLREALSDLPRRRQVTENRLREAAFRRTLATIGLDQLDAYPGIGPATIAKLRDGGFLTVADLLGAPLNLPGLGQKRLGDLENAIADLAKQARARFDAGACPEAHELAAELAVLAQHYRDLESQAQTRARAAEAFLYQLEPFVVLAGSLTFTAYLHRRGARLVPREVLQAPLPALEELLEREERAAAPPVLKTECSAKRPAPPAPEIAQVPVNGVAASREAHLATLAIEIAAPDAAHVRRQYRLLTERYNPDRVRELGDEFVVLAERKRDAAQVAAKALLAEMGEPLDAPEPPASTDLRANPELEAFFGE